MARPIKTGRGKGGGDRDKVTPGGLSIGWARVWQWRERRSESRFGRTAWNSVKENPSFRC